MIYLASENLTAIQRKEGKKARDAGAKAVVHMGQELGLILSLIT